MITSMHIENFKCFKDFNIDLGPFNVLIGPNDSGKTALLQAVMLAGAHGPGPLSGASPIAFRLADADDPTTERDVFWKGDPSRELRIRAETDVPELQAKGIALVLVSREGYKLELGPADNYSLEWQRSDAYGQWFARSLARVRCYRFDPSGLRHPSSLGAHLTWKGSGFPTFLNTILQSDREAFFAMEREFYTRFPYYTRIELPTQDAPGGGKALGLLFRTRLGQLLSVGGVSDGVLLSLAFLALAHHDDRPTALLIEEPETGVHHASLKEIVKTVRQMSADKGVQVILTTHSPYLLDEVSPDEVHVFQKDEEGAVHARKLSEFEGAAEIGDMFSTGEKWSMLSERYGI